MTQQKPQNRIRIDNVRLSFPNVFVPKAAKPGDTPKYSAAGLMEKTHPQLAALGALVTKVAKEKWGEKAATILTELKAANKLPVHDGDAKASQPGYAGMLFINASNSIPPTVLDENKNPITVNAGKIYAGVYVNFAIDVWAQDNAYGKRVNASLAGLQFVKHGERLAGGGIASPDDFVEVASEDGAAATEGAASLF